MTCWRLLCFGYSIDSLLLVTFPRGVFPGGDVVMLPSLHRSKPRDGRRGEWGAHRVGRSASAAVGPQVRRPVLAGVRVAKNVARIAD